MQASVIAAALAAIAMACAGQASAQTALIGWSPKPDKATPWVAPNRPHTKLSDVLAKHRGKSDWVEPVVRDRDYEADYIAMAPGAKTKTQFFADDRVFWMIQDGAIRFTIEGQEPFVATKGFLVQVPFRTPYSLETVGETPSLRFEVRRTGALPLYVASETPPPVRGETYQKVSYAGRGSYDDVNRPYLDFNKEVVNSGKPYPRRRDFVNEANSLVAVLRGEAQPRAPDSNRGHFHLNYAEFWFIQEGKIDYLMEGVPFFTADQGDVVYAPAGRWHRASFSSQGRISTRLGINKRPDGMHNYAEDAGARQ